MLSLVGLVRPLSGYMALAIVMGLTGHLCAALITVFGGYGVLNALGVDTPLRLKAIFLFLAVFALVRGLLRYAEQACNHFIAFKLLALIRDRVFGALRRLAPAKLEGRDRGDLISVITSDIELLEVFYAHTISPAAIAVLFTVPAVLFLGSFHWLYAAIGLLAYLAVGVAVPLITSRLSGEDGDLFRARSGALSAFVLDTVRGLPELIQFGAGKRRTEKMRAMTDELSAVDRKMKLRAGRNGAVTNTVILLFDLLMLAAAAALYRKGAVGFDGVLIPVLALMSSFGPVTALAALGSTLQSTFAAGNRVLDILEEQPVTEEIAGKPTVDFNGASLENVSFAYEKEQILGGVSLRFPASKIVGVVGKSGSGKSTVLKLLMRFWDADGGSVRISGRDVREINTRDLRNKESYVTQETHLFHDSIANNLRAAKPEATDEELEAACRKAAVHDFIMTLPRGYDTPVGELGDTLSGGERQRLGIARAFLYDAPLMLLDEPTSNLDSLNEAVILRSLKEETGDKTVVLVSHRPSTTRIADTVIHMESGRNS